MRRKRPAPVSFTAGASMVAPPGERTAGTASAGAATRPTSRAARGSSVKNVGKSLRGFFIGGLLYAEECGISMATEGAGEPGFVEAGANRAVLPCVRRAALCDEHREKHSEQGHQQTDDREPTSKHCSRLLQCGRQCLNLTEWPLIAPFIFGSNLLIAVRKAASCVCAGPAYVQMTPRVRHSGD